MGKKTIIKGKLIIDIDMEISGDKTQFSPEALVRKDLRLPSWRIKPGALQFTPTEFKCENRAPQPNYWIRANNVWERFRDSLQARGFINSNGKFLKLNEFTISNLKCYIGLQYNSVEIRYIIHNSAYPYSQRIGNFNYNLISMGQQFKSGANVICDYDDPQVFQKLETFIADEVLRAIKWVKDNYNIDVTQK